MSVPRDDTGSDRARWTARWEADVADARSLERPPSRWVIERCLELAPSLVLCDLASGVGRHAVPLARAGRTVIALDLVESAVRAAVGPGAREGPASGRGALLGVVADARALPLRAASLDAIVCVNYLDRPLFEWLRALLRPGGWLIYETYTVAHATLVREGRARAPRDPRYLLESGELARLVAPLEIVAAREELVIDEAGERAVASVMARRRE